MNPVLLYGLMRSEEDVDRLAINIAQVTAEQLVSIEDRPMFVRVAVRVLHTDEEGMIANTVCRILGLTTKKKKNHA